jgi:cell division protein FtsL
MLRFLNILAIVSLMGSAVYAYTIKYQTSYRAEQIAKTQIEIKSERDAIAVLRAEWAFLTRPERIQQLSDRYLDLQATTVSQIATAQSLPERAPRVDSIGQTLDALGLGMPNSPAIDKTVTSTTPRADKPATTTKAASTSAKNALKATGH